MSKNILKLKSLESMYYNNYIIRMLLIFLFSAQKMQNVFEGQNDSK